MLPFAGHRRSDSEFFAEVYVKATIIVRPFSGLVSPRVRCDTEAKVVAEPGESVRLPVDSSNTNAVDTRLDTLT